VSKKFIKREGLKWVEKELISKEQYDSIVSLYHNDRHGGGTLTLFGGILIGLGILSFIAANWSAIPSLLRFALILILLLAFYAVGERQFNRGNENLGISMIGMGLFSFGAGIFLIGQMFHLVAYHAGSFIVWGVTGALLTYLYRSRFLFLMSLIIFNAGQIYAMISFNSFSYASLIIMLATLGPYWWRYRSEWLSWIVAFSVLLQTTIMVVEENGQFLWFLLPAAALYAAGDWIKERHTSYPLQTLPLAVAFLFGAILIMTGESDELLRNSSPWDPLYYWLAISLLFVLSVWAKRLQQRTVTLLEWLLFIPYFLLGSQGVEIYYLMALFLYSLYVLWRGYVEHSGNKINFGTLLFILTTLTAYGKLTWGFMDKSVFFLIGGLILLGLSWLLGRGKRLYFKGEADGGGMNDDQ
jgi:uncharacterized membrane protein